MTNLDMGIESAFFKFSVDAECSPTSCVVKISLKLPSGLVLTPIDSVPPASSDFPKTRGDFSCAGTHLSIKQLAETHGFILSTNREESCICRGYCAKEINDLENKTVGIV